MKVEIWSDVVCPFCYIGKRKFEGALNQFANNNNVEIEWKSFQLSPDMKTEPGKNLNRFLAEHKGISIEQAAALNQQVTAMAAQEGLTYNLDNAVVANTLNAHRFLHFAKQHGKQNEAEEALFRAYFTDGKNIDDHPTLLQLGEALGLDTTALQTALENGSYANEVRNDIIEAQRIGVRGVPFFVFDRKYAVSGAQPTEVFLNALKKSFEEWQQQNAPTLQQVADGATCTTDGECK